jgi:hypothetical protein
MQDRGADKPNEHNFSGHIDLDLANVLRVVHQLIEAHNRNIDLRNTRKEHVRRNRNSLLLLNFKECDLQ